MATIGMAINLFVASRRGAEAMGIFHQGYAVFMVAGQLATLAINDSVQKHIAEHVEHAESRSAILRAGILGVSLFASAIGLLLLFLAPALGRLVDSPPVGAAVAVVAPGTCLFAINKTVLGALNGAREMRTFAIAQGIRLSMVLLGVVVVASMDTPDWLLVAAFTCAEALLLPMVLFATRRHWLTSTLPGSSSTWLKRHFRFGIRAVSNGFLSASFSRIDILMLGLFVTDSMVGIYSFAAIFVEGVYQLPVVVRTVANPVLVRLFMSARRADVSSFCRRIGTVSVGVFIPVALAVYVAFPLLTAVVDPALVADSRRLLPPLLTGLLIYSAFIPSDHLLLQAGRPGTQSLLMACNVIINIVLNAALIPRLGIAGAALATGITFVLSSITLNVAVMTVLGMPAGLFGAPR